MKTIHKKLIYFVLFAIAMGFMESAVVIYLREIYYPSGFRFPLIPIPQRLAVVEILREAATIIMLVCVGYFAGKTKLQRFAFFNIAFAVWDLCYYLFLYIFLGWPESLFTWDILFLIPVPWVGPVWAPCLLCALMVAGSIPVILKIESGHAFRVKTWQWVTLLAGGAICIISFMLDYILMVRSAATNPLVSTTDLFSDIHSYVPQSFHLSVFLPGFVLMLLVTLHNIFITNKNH